MHQVQLATWENKLCGKTFQAPFHCKRHFNQRHVSGYLSYHSNPIYPCKRQQGNCKRNDGDYFHCPVCKKTVPPRPAFITNPERHLPQQARPDVEMSEACKGRGDILDLGEVYRLQHEVHLRSQNQAEPAGVKQIYQRGRPRWWRGDWRQCSRGSRGDPKQKRQAFKKALGQFAVRKCTQKPLPGAAGKSMQWRQHWWRRWAISCAQ